MDEKSLLQLSVPQLRFPAQSESLSQSPPPTVHGLEDEQQLHSVLGTPLHELDGDCVVVAVPVKYLECDFLVVINLVVARVNSKILQRYFPYMY